MKLKIIFFIVCASALVSSAFGEDGGTLAKIKKSGMMTLGIREASLPFSYYNDKQQAIGYSIDLCNRVVDAVKKKLDMPNLVVKEVPDNPLNRMPLLSNGTTDLECGITTNNTIRERQISFSNTMFVISVRLLVRKNSGIKDFKDLAGKNVSTVAGTPAEQMLKQMNYKDNMHMNVISTKDDAGAFLTFQSGRADALYEDDVLIYGQLAKAPDRNDFELIGKPSAFEAYGLGMRKNDPEFKTLVDDTLASVMKSGEIDKLYKKWFMSPIPPNGIRLDFPTNDQTREAFAHPNDKPFQ